MTQRLSGGACFSTLLSQVDVFFTADTMYRQPEWVVGQSSGGDASFPLKQGNRNGTVYVNGASPFKSDTMVQGSGYSGSLSVFKRAIPPALHGEKAIQRRIARGSHGNGVRAASSSGELTSRRRSLAIGKNARRVGLKLGEPSQYRSNGPIPRKQALARVRGGGTVAPPKKGAYQRF